MSIALARRYRPRRFGDLLAQDHVAATLRAAVARGRVGHGYLLTGPRGVGKTTAARVLAMALNCERRAGGEGEPCGDCETCRRIWTGAASLDVVEIDAASNRGVDDARDLRERAMYAASREGGHKVYIVDEAHMLTREAWNALLKILEEPPPGVVFVFATTEPQKILNTAAPVLSRLQRFDFRRIGAGVIRDRLADVLRAEGIEAEEDALRLIARHADGGMRDALSILDQCLSFGDGTVTAARVRATLGLIADELYGEVLAVVADRRPDAVFDLVARLLASGADLTTFMAGVGELFRGALMRRLGVEPEGITLAMRETIESLHGRFEPGDLVRMLRLLGEEEQGIRRSGNPRLVVETLLLRWALLDRMVDLEAVLGSGSAGGREGGKGPEGGRGSGERETGSGTVERRAPGQPERRVIPGAELVIAEARPATAPAAPPRALPRATFDVAGLRGVWEHLIESGRGTSPLLGEALSHATPLEVSPPDVVLELRDDNHALQRPLERHSAMVESLLGASVGQLVRLVIRLADERRNIPGPGKGRRLSEATLRAERLEAGRKKDPALDAASQALDLEVVE
ncbi:MAG: DNA polymerase III subunit gamma/tau [Gemmatimonadales bacterium]